MRVPDEIAGEGPADDGARQDLELILRRLIESQLYGVLCTQSQGQPYGSLMAYAMTPGLDFAVFSTQKATRKYRLLSECAQVSFVIDNRSALSGQLMDLEAVTMTGRAREVAAGAEGDRWSRLLIDRHPYLSAFVRSPSCALFLMEITRHFHVGRFQEVRQWVPKSPA